MTTPAPSLQERECRTLRVEKCIDDAIARYPGHSTREQASYFEDVHQHLAPLARQLEAELAAAQEENRALWMQLADAKRAALPPQPVVPERLAELRRLAMAATTWTYDSNQTPFGNDAEGGCYGGDNDGTYCLFGPEIVIDGELYDPSILSERCSEVDAKYIAAANPATILALLDALAAATSPVTQVAKQAKEN